MKKCRVITSWPTDSGVGSGVVTVVQSLRRILRDKGFEPELVSEKRASGGYLSTSLGRIIFNIKLRGVRQVQDGIPTATFDFDGFAFRSNIRFVSINQGILRDIVQFETGAVRQSVRVLAALEERALAKADKVFVPSIFSAGKVADLYAVPAHKIVVAPNGVFPDTVPAPTKKTGTASVFCAARLYKRKGVDTLIRAWRNVVSELPEATLKIAGEGLELGRLKRMADELRLNSSVHFLGDVTSREEMARLFAECDLFCLPSRHETFGIVFLEAMSAGKPVVALNSTAVPELVRHGVDGILAEPDGKGVAEAVISMLKDDGLREKMGAAGRKRALSDFLWEKTSEPIADYFLRW